MRNVARICTSGRTAEFAKSLSLMAEPTPPLAGACLATGGAEGTRSACYPEEDRMSRHKMLFNRQGFALEATLFVLLLLAVLCVFAVSGVTTTTRTANYDYRNTRTAYAAEAASDDIMQQLSGMVDDGFISQSRARLAARDRPCRASRSRP